MHISRQFSGQNGGRSIIRVDDLTSTKCNKTIPNEQNTCSLRYAGTFSSGPCPRLPNIRADTSKYEHSGLRPDCLLKAFFNQSAPSFRQVKVSRSVGVVSHSSLAFFNASFRAKTARTSVTQDAKLSSSVTTSAR